MVHPGVLSLGQKYKTTYFPKESFIRFDHSHISDLVHLLDEPLSDINIEAMRYSRDLALNKYALWPTIDRMINECGI